MLVPGPLVGNSISVILNERTNFMFIYHFFPYCKKCVPNPASTFQQQTRDPETGGFLQEMMSLSDNPLQERKNNPNSKCILLSECIFFSPYVVFGFFFFKLQPRITPLETAELSTTSVLGLCFLVFPPHSPLWCLSFHRGGELNNRSTGRAATW